MTENTDIIKEAYKSGQASSLPTWCIFGVGLALILAVQVGTTVSILRGSKDMRQLLSTAQQYATELERSIGYGGLIHHFKNYVLRPHNAHHRIAAYTDAARAKVVVVDLQRIAESLGVPSASFTHTLDMVEGYSERLGIIKELAETGYSTNLIDDNVRFDDALALQEVSEVIGQLSTAINEGIAEVYHHGLLVSLLGTVGTAALGFVLTVIVIRRQQRYSKSIIAIANRLNDTNDGLRKANTSLNMFAGIVSHDLKSPVRAISIYNHMIADDIQDASAVSQHVAGVQKSIDNIIKIVDSLLEFTKVGFSPPQLTVIDVQNLIDRLEKGYELEIDGILSGLIFNVNIDVPVLADPEQLSRVFFSLIENAHKFSHDDQPNRIVVRGWVEGKFALFSVTDNGIGIDPRNAERVFEPLKCLHGSDSKYEGTGIGLSLVRSIAEGHGGKAWLDTDYRSGTRFMFSIPLAADTDYAMQG